jgi:hypothetical protein
MPAPAPSSIAFNRKERKERKERKARTMLFFKQTLLFAFFAFFAVPLGFSWSDACSAEETGQPFVRLYDTNVLSSEVLTVEAVAAKAGWVEVPADDKAHKFKGDVAFGNERFTVVLRAKGGGAEVRTSTGGPKFLTVLDPETLASEVERAAAFRIIENTSGAVAVESTLTGSVTVTFRVAVGQPYVEVWPGAGMAELWVLTGPSQIVVPDFFGDDMVFPAKRFGLTGVRLPAENFVLGLSDIFDCVTMCVWQHRSTSAQAVSCRDRSKMMFAGWKIDCIKGKSIWVAFLEAKWIWYEHLVPAEDAGKSLDWQPPFPAKWRADLVRDNGFTESLTLESPPALAPGHYVIYPLDRTRATPLTEFTPVDILRNTLGVGPCQYILETEGLATAENPTPDNVLTWVEKQLKKKGGKDAADEIRERLKAMVELAGRTEARIKRYSDFAAEMKQLLASDSSEAGLKLKATVDALVKAAADGFAATQPPGRIANLADAVAGLIGKDTAAADLAAPAAELRAIGAAQDRALAKSRMAVRWLGCQAPASEIAKRTEAFLQGK